MNMKTSVLAISALLSTSLMAAEPTNQELLDILKKQQEKIEALEKALTKTDKKIEETDQKVESSADAIEQSLVSTNSKTQIGGYGELHYNNIEETESIDFHRFVLFFGHEFTDSIRFFSE